MTIPAHNIIYKKHLDGQILYHYCSREPLPGSTPVAANFEDAYVALLLMREKPDAAAMEENESPGEGSRRSDGGLARWEEQPESS